MLDTDEKRFRSIIIFSIIVCKTIRMILYYISRKKYYLYFLFYVKKKKIHRSRIFIGRIIVNHDDIVMLPVIYRLYYNIVFPVRPMV